MKNWYLELVRRNSFLAYSGLIYAIIFLIMVFLPLVDSREIIGVSVWNKPMKFFISTTVLLWTIGWIMEELPSKRSVKIVSIGVFLFTFLELILITFQAAQGKASHFNVGNPMDGLIFGLMGIFIFANSLFFIYLFFLFLRVKTLPTGYKTGILFGLFIFLVGGYEGYLMAGRLSHTVGAADGQDGIFFLTWAKSYGDLRIFHFLGLHGLQVMSLIGWYLFRNQNKAMWITGLLYCIFSSGILWYALQGKSFF